MIDDVPHLTRAGLAGGTALGLSLLLTPIVRRIAVGSGLIAKPIEDRWGRRVVARLGGIGMMAAIVLSALLWVPAQARVLPFLIGLVLVAAIGLVDDLRRMSPYTKLVLQLLTGCLVVVMGVRVHVEPWPWLSIPLSVLWFVLMMNAFNLLDNMDGLAAGVGAIAAGFCAFHAVMAGQATILVLDLILMGSCLGFLRYNFPPAKIYMGDSGSHVLGLSLAMLALLSDWRPSAHLLTVLAIPTLVLAVPIFDTTFVTIQRLLHRRHVFVGGRDHVSHRLAILGLSVEQTVLALYVFSICLGIVSVVSVMLKPLAAAALWLAVATALMLFGRYLGQVNVYRFEERGREPREVAIGTASRTMVDTMLLHKRRLLEILVDFALMSSAYVFAHMLRFEGSLTGDLQQLVVQSLPLILAIKLSCFAGMGLYLRVWRYPDLSDIVTIFKAVTLGSILSAVALVLGWRFDGYSRAVLIIDWMLAFLLIGGSRMAERLLNEWIGSAAEPGRAVVIVGAGETGERVLRNLRHGGRADCRIVGFLDDDARKAGARLHGFRVLGGRGRLAALISEHQVQEVLIAIADPPGDLLQHVRACCGPHGVAWKVVTAGVTGIL